MLARYDATPATRVDGQKHGEVQTTSAGVLLTAPAAGTAGGAPSTGTQSSVADAASSTTILAANTSRKGATVYNDSTVNLYLLCAAGTASSTNFSVLLMPGDYYELPVCQGGVYTGILVGIWASDASGSARVTEFT